jgi:acetoin utilization deacetylase AcuC-like enzyme
LRIVPRAATVDELAACHTREYIRLVEAEVAQGARVLSTGDTDICPDSLEVARAAAGGAFQAVDAVMEGRAQNAFCVVRPPGHHASADRGMGFCIFNNVALAARYAQRRHGVERVLIADWDVHHGNGTQDIFYDRSDVLYVSLHGDPAHAFPYFSGYADETGAARGTGFNLNLPLPAGTEFSAWQAALLAALKRLADFRADALIVSLGVDTFADDPISFFRLQSADFLTYGQLLGACNVPTLFVLEGGYAVDAIGVNVVNVLMGFEAPGA